MKSIVEEASSVSKAIENAWKRAEQPTEFSIRIHELPQKNMFGFTTKPAKISLFFQEDNKKNNYAKSVNHTSSTNPIPSTNKPTTVKAQPQKRTQEQALPQKAAKQPTQSTQTTPKAPRTENNEPWSSEMIAYTENWLRELLQKLEIKDAHFEAVPQRYHLKISFAKPIFAEEEKNRAFFRNCAHLGLQATRNAFKRPLKGFKAILTSEQA